LKKVLSATKIEIQDGFLIPIAGDSERGI